MSRLLAKIPHVLIVMPTSLKAGRDKLQGILHYAHVHGPWDVQILQEQKTKSHLGSFKNWRPDGIIEGESREAPVRVGQSFNVPTVRLDPDSPVSRGCSTVCHDSRQIAETVADFYLRLGFKQFGFVGSIPLFSWSSERAAAFADRLELAGCRCARYVPKQAKDWGLEQTYLRNWLLALPKPCGIMAATDYRAKQVLDICLAAAIRVPEELSVIGVDNDTTVCEHTTPTLSSVLPDFEGGGYQAAEVLDNMMRNRRLKARHLTYGIKRLIQRQSSLYIPRADAFVLNAIEFIRLNAGESISVPDIAQHLKVSRRFIEIRFRKTLGHSVHAEIQHHRLERVCALLRETNLPIHEIGERCGYPTETYLKALFKSRFGVTMRDYRKCPTSPSSL